MQVRETEAPTPATAPPWTRSRTGASQDDQGGEKKEALKPRRAHPTRLKNAASKERLRLTGRNKL